MQCNENVFGTVFFLELEVKCLLKSLLLCIVFIVVLHLDNDLCKEEKNITH